jgi:hypothetical protein
VRVKLQQVPTGMKLYIQQPRGVTSNLAILVLTSESLVQVVAFLWHAAFSAQDSGKGDDTSKHMAGESAFQTAGSW